jgi:Protein of unknown function (DUF3592)
MLPAFIGKLATRLLILFFGLLFLLPPAYKLYKYCAFRYHAVSVDGIITGPSGGRDLGGRPFVEYKDSLGHSYERKSRAKTNWFFRPKVGNKIKIFYNKRDPHVAIVDSEFYYIVLPLCLMAIGACFLFCLFRDILAPMLHKIDGRC